jgi:hypothetical protein
MIAYRVFYKNYKLKKSELIGRLLERRKDLRGKNRVESGLKWAKQVLGPVVKDQHAIFVVPDEIDQEGQGSSAYAKEEKLIRLQDGLIQK